MIHSLLLHLSVVSTDYSLLSGHTYHTCWNQKRYKETVEQLKDKDIDPISTADGIKLQSELVNVEECSALTQYGLKRSI